MFLWRTPRWCTITNLPPLFRSPFSPSPDPRARSTTANDPPHPLQRTPRPLRRPPRPLRRGALTEQANNPPPHTQKKNKNSRRRRHGLGLARRPPPPLRSDIRRLVALPSEVSRCAAISPSGQSLPNTAPLPTALSRRLPSTTSSRRRHRPFTARYTSLLPSSLLTVHAPICPIRFHAGAHSHPSFH